MAGIRCFRLFKTSGSEMKTLKMRPLFFLALLAVLTFAPVQAQTP